MQVAPHQNLPLLVSTDNLLTNGVLVFKEKKKLTICKAHYS